MHFFEIDIAALQLACPSFSVLILTSYFFVLFLYTQHPCIHISSLPLTHYFSGDLGTLSLGIAYHTCNATKVARYIHCSLFFFFFFHKAISDHLLILITFLLDYLAINEFFFRRIWRIKQIEEGIIYRGRRPRWIIPSEICLILHTLRKKNSLFVLLFIQNNS